MAPEEPRAFESEFEIDTSNRATLQRNGQVITRQEYRKRWAEYEKKLTENERKTGEISQKIEGYGLKLNTLYKHLYVERKVMTADRVVRVITHTNSPIIGLIRTDDLYYLKSGKVVKCESGTPASQEKLVNMYYPGED